MWERRVVQRRVHPLKRVRANNVEVLRPDDKRVTLTLPTDCWRDLKRRSCEERKVHMLDPGSISMVQGPVNSRHVPKLVKAAKVPAVGKGIVGPGILHLVHAKPVHKFMELASHRNLHATT